MWWVWGLSEGALGVRELTKHEIDCVLDLMHCSDVNEARLNESKHSSRTSMQYIHRDRCRTRAGGHVVQAGCGTDSLSSCMQDEKSSQEVFMVLMLSAVHMGTHACEAGWCWGKGRGSEAEQG